MSLYRIHTAGMTEPHQSSFVQVGNEGNYPHDHDYFLDMLLEKIPDDITACPMDLPIPTGDSTTGVSRQNSTSSRQQRNRVAQKKFRDRQKARIHQMEEEIRRQKNTIANLLSENAILRGSCDDKQQETFFIEDQFKMSLIPGKANDLEASSSQNYMMPNRKSYISADAGDGKGLRKPSSSVFLRKCWSNFAQEMQLLVQQYERGTHEVRSHVMTRLKNEIKDGVDVYFKGIMTQQRLLQDYCVWSDEWLFQAHPGKGTKWASVVQSMELDIGQIEQISALKNMFAPKIEMNHSLLLRRMKSLQGSLSEMMRSNHISSAALDGLDQTILGIKLCLQEKCQNALEYLTIVFISVLNPLQSARCIAMSYPDYPDIYQMSTSIQELQCGLSQGEETHCS